MATAAEKNILVVEDEPDVQLVLSTALQDAGFSVRTASNGHEAYNQVKFEVPDLITLDLVMPGMSGALFYSKLRKNTNWGNIPVIVISAHAKDEFGRKDFEDMMRGREFEPPQAFLEKPVDTADLIRKVAELLEVEATEILAGPEAQTREEILSKLNGVDLDTLKKVREVLNR